MRPTDVPELQVELEEFLRSEVGIDFCQKFSSDGRVPLKPKILADVLREAESYWVSTQMCELAHHAARTMPPQPTLPTDLPSVRGFCLFENPANIESDGDDDAREFVSICGFAWGPATFTLKGIDKELDGVKWWYLSDRYQGSHGGWFSYSTTTFLPVLQTGDPFKNDDPAGKEMSAQVSALLEVAEKENLGPNATAFRRLPHAIWALMGQRIAVTEQQRPERATRRRLEKAGHPKHVSTIRVVTLRRLKSDEGHSGDGVRKDWKHMWIVSGHWRNQFLPSTKAHRLQWISPYAKGDGPLIIKETVNVLKR